MINNPHEKEYKMTFFYQKDFFKEKKKKFLK